MSYDPSVEAVYDQYTDSKYYNNILQDCREETVLSAIYQLGQEYDGLCRRFKQTESDSRYGYDVDMNENRPTIKSRILLSRYLSAVYRVIESVRVCLSVAAGEPLERIKLRPPMTRARSRWDGNDGGREKWSRPCDKVMTRLTYLRGLRNAVVHGTNDGFDAEHDEEIGRVVLSVNPSELDDDPALRGRDRDHEPASYSFTDTYFRFEKNKHEAVYPVDNIMKYHDKVIFPFVRAFEKEL